MQLLTVLGALGFFSLLGWLIQKAITSKANELSLKKEIDSLNEEKVNFKQKIEQLEKENVSLKKEIEKQSLQFDQGLHCYKDTSGVLYCPPCYDDKGKEIHLKPCADPSYGWQCPACQNIVKNPNYRSPDPKPHKPYNPFDQEF